MSRVAKRLPLSSACEKVLRCSVPGLQLAILRVERMTRRGATLLWAAILCAIVWLLLAAPLYYMFFH
jgi:hypothetical protein